MKNELFKCKFAITKCVPLKRPKKNLAQVDWTLKYDFNPFTEIRIELEDGTFDGEKSGLKTFLIR
jgi:hypothetical protein